MGQRIQATATILDNVAVLETDRTLTGQDGKGYSHPSETRSPSGLLANRLREADPAIGHIHILSNMISIARDGGWGPGDLERALGVVSGLFEFYPDTNPDDKLRDDQLRSEEYNATISSIRVVNDDLWVIRIRPDSEIKGYLPGKYTTLALGYWESRNSAQDTEDHVKDRTALARRSYSVSSSIIDTATGSLLPPPTDEVEFYIVKVPPTFKESPALTPRIFQKSEGDRIYMGTKFTGRYTLEGVEAEDQVVFLSTGTGEAPQNAMTAELLRQGHLGPILNLVCVRLRSDLGYLAEHEVVADRYPNYRYETLTTREPENVGQKLYIQDLIELGEVDKMLGSPLDPSNTHVFLCGNPVMIGLPTWDDDQPTFPETTGVCELLHRRGFTIDHRKTRGNVHYEEYWKER